MLEYISWLIGWTFVSILLWLILGGPTFRRFLEEKGYLVWDLFFFIITLPITLISVTILGIIYLMNIRIGGKK